MTSNWLGRTWPQLYPIVHGSTRFKGLKHWGDVVDRTAAGAYIVVALDPKTAGEERRVIHRMFLPDATGTLYIGAGNNLASRLGKLGNSILSESKTGGHPLKLLRHALYGSLFPVETLAVCWFETADKESAHNCEAKLATKYVTMFHERPPFDGQGAGLAL